MAARVYIRDSGHHGFNVLPLEERHPLVAILDAERLDVTFAGFQRLRLQGVPLRRLVVGNNESIDGARLGAAVPSTNLTE